MAGEVEKYLEARAAFEDADKAIDIWRTVLVEVMRGLQDARGTFHFSNLATALPPEATLGPRTMHVDANRWPSAEAIQLTLVGWHVTKAQMLASYQAVPQHIRSGVLPPAVSFCRTFITSIIAFGS